MSNEQIDNNALDKLMRNALSSNEDLVVPSGLADKTVRKLEKGTILRELILELIFKFGIVLTSLAILAIVFVLFNGREVIGKLYTLFINNQQIIVSLLLLAFITILIDQVVLRLYNAMNKEVNWKV